MEWFLLSLSLSLSLCERSLLHGFGPVQVFRTGLKGLYQKPRARAPPPPDTRNSRKHCEQVGGARVSILSFTSQREERLKISPLLGWKRRRTGHRPAAHRHNNRGPPFESPEPPRAALQSARAALRLPHQPGALSALRCNHVRLTAPTGPPPLI